MRKMLAGLLAAALVANGMPAMAAYGETESGKQAVWEEVQGSEEAAPVDGEDGEDEVLDKDSQTETKVSDEADRDSEDNASDDEETFTGDRVQESSGNTAYPNTATSSEADRDDEEEGGEDHQAAVSTPSEAGKDSLTGNLQEATPSEANRLAPVSVYAGESGVYQLEAENTDIADSSNTKLNGDGDRLELQTGGSVTWHLNKVQEFQTGSYLVSVNMNGNTQTVAVSVNGVQKGTITKAFADYYADDLEEYLYHGVLELKPGDDLTITEDGGSFGHLDWVKLERMETAVCWIEAEDRTVTEFTGSLHGDGDRVELNSGNSITFRLSKVSGFQAGTYLLYAGANGARSSLKVAVDGIEAGFLSTPGTGKFEKGTCVDCSFGDELSLQAGSTITLSDTDGSWGHVDYIRLVKTGELSAIFDKTDPDTGLRITAEDGVLPGDTEIIQTTLSGNDRKKIRALFKEQNQKVTAYSFTLKNNGAEIPLDSLTGEVTAHFPIPKGYDPADSVLCYMETPDSDPGEVAGTQTAGGYIKTSLSDYGIYLIADENSWQLEGEDFYQSKADQGHAADLQPLDQIDFAVPDDESFENGTYNLFIRACGYQSYTILVNGREAGSLAKADTSWGEYGLYTVPAVLTLKKGDTLSVRSDSQYGWVDYIRLIPCSPFEETDSDVTVSADVGVVPSGAILSVTEADESRLEEIGRLFGFTDGQAPLMSFYEISLILDGAAVQPGGTLKISLPLPDGFNRDTLSLYYISDDDRKSRLPYQFNEGTGQVEFTTDHLSCYGLINQAPGAEYYYEAENYYSQTTGGGMAADLQPEEEITFTPSDLAGFAEGNYELSVKSNGNRTKYIVKINGIPVGVISRESSDFDMTAMNEAALGEILHLREDDRISIYGPGATGQGPFGWVDYIKLRETEKEPAKAGKPKTKITLEAEDYYPDTLEEGGKVANLDHPDKKLEIPVLASQGFVEKDYLLTLYTTGTMRSYRVLVNGDEVLSGERAGSGYGMAYMTREVGSRLIHLKPGDMLTVSFPPQDTDNYGNWIDRIVLNSNRKAPTGNLAVRFGGRIAKEAAELLLKDYGPRTTVEKGALIYQGEAYYTKQNDNPAADLQPGEQILIPVSDNGGFTDGTYRLTVRSCGNREAFTVKVNGIRAGGISRKGTDYGMDSMTDDAMGNLLELRAGDLVALEGETGGRYGWVDYISLTPVARGEESGKPETFTWEGEDFYTKQKDNPAADLQPGEEVVIPLGSNEAFQDGLYYMTAVSCGDRTALDVKVNGEMLGSITRNKTNFSMSGMTMDTLLRPVFLTAGDAVSLCAPGEKGSTEGPWGWMDKLTLIPAPAPSPESLEEYRYPAQAYGKASLYLPAADFQPGQKLVIPLSDNLQFQEGEYRLMVVSNGTREEFTVRKNHEMVGVIRRKPTDYGDNGMSSDELPGTLWLTPSDTITITGQEGDAFGWVSALVLEPVGQEGRR